MFYVAELCKNFIMAADPCCWPGGDGIWNYLCSADLFYDIVTSCHHPYFTSDCWLQPESMVKGMTWWCCTTGKWSLIIWRGGGEGEESLTQGCHFQQQFRVTRNVWLPVIALFCAISPVPQLLQTEINPSWPSESAINLHFSLHLYSCFPGTVFTHLYLQVSPPPNNYTWHNVILSYELFYQHLLISVCRFVFLSS